jgi:phosphotriesterase-related protein
MRYLAGFAIVLFIIGFTACNETPANDVFMSVNGLVDTDSMGVTLSHEHVLVDWIGADSTGSHRWNRDKVVEKVLPFFMEAKEQGVETIMEFTPAYLGRDPMILHELSRQSGIEIISNTGYYGAVDNRFMPDHAYNETSDELSRRWIDEFQSGIDGSDVRPGFIKISVAERVPLSEFHQKIVTSAIKTHLETGMVIASHTIGDIPAMKQIKLLEADGVSPEAWIWTHAQSGSLEANIEAASKGAWIGLDNVRFDPNREENDTGSISWYVERMDQLRQAGLLNRVLISHDAGWYDPDKENGGDFRGYSDIFDHLIPEMKESGFTEEEIAQLLVKNPANAFRIRVKETE